MKLAEVFADVLLTVLTGKNRGGGNLRGAEGTFRIY